MDIYIYKPLRNWVDFPSPYGNHRNFFSTRSVLRLDLLHELCSRLVGVVGHEHHPLLESQQIIHRGHGGFGILVDGGARGPADHWDSIRVPISNNAIQKAKPPGPKPAIYHEPMNFK